MKRFSCACGHPVFFENVVCLACARRLAFSPDDLDMLALEPMNEGLWRTLEDSDTARRLCRHDTDYDVCNWLVPAATDGPYCVSCAMNRTIPDLSVPGNAERWARMEAAKRRLVYSLLELRLPLKSPALAGERAAAGLQFAFLADTPGEHVVTGHEDGLITLAIAEADDVTRAAVRQQLGEPYRTLLGHFRHESGHYYWEVLVRDTPWHQPFRALFGDESTDYASALERHYREGPPPTWADSHVSAYASAHPHEDWAETWAHYLHIRDSLDTAHGYGFIAAPDPAADPASAADDFAAMVQAWVRITLGLNALNRSMGLPDIYPFVLPQASIDKLQFVHDVVCAGGVGSAEGKVAACPPVTGSTSR